MGIAGRAIAGAGAGGRTGAAAGRAGAGAGGGAAPRMADNRNHAGGRWLAISLYKTKKKCDVMAIIKL